MRGSPGAQDRAATLRRWPRHRQSARARRRRSAARALVVDIVVPVHNEERGLEASVRRLHRHPGGLPLPGAHHDRRQRQHRRHLGGGARRLERELPGVRALRLAEKGRGRALRAAWGSSDAPVLAYMDVDLSTDLAALLPLVAPLVGGHSDVAIGTRLAPGARVVRGTKRELISRGYNALLRTALCARFSDAQCGFKAIRADVARALLPLVRDGEWFFDTELLVLAERAGLRIHEVPVDWVDDPDSRVAIVDTALADLRGVGRLAWGLVTGSLGGAVCRRRRAARWPSSAGSSAGSPWSGRPARWPTWRCSCC